MAESQKYCIFQDAIHVNAFQKEHFPSMMGKPHRKIDNFYFHEMIYLSCVELVNWLLELFNLSQIKINAFYDCIRTENYLYMTVECETCVMLTLTIPPPVHLNVYHTIPSDVPAFHTLLSDR